MTDATTAPASSATTESAVGEGTEVGDDGAAPQKHQKSRIILTVVIGAILVFMIGYYIRREKRREGYEEVPTSLTV